MNDKKVADLQAYRNQQRAQKVRLEMVDWLRDVADALESGAAEDLGEVTAGVVFLTNKEGLVSIIEAGEIDQKTYERIVTSATSLARGMDEDMTADE